MVMNVTWNDLLLALKEFIEEAIKDLRLPIRSQSKEDEAAIAEDPDKEYRVPEVYRMRLPNSKEAKKKAPYVLVQLITTGDVQDERQIDDSYTVIRIILCTYNKDEQEGSLALLNLASRIRIALLQKCTVGENNAFWLDKTEKLEFMAYPDDTAPYYAGEMIGVWHLPPIKREVQLW
jgi:hypothetical protein